MRKFSMIRIRNGNEFYVLKGVEIPITEFHDLFPIAEKIKIRSREQLKGGVNPDWRQL
jgi:hypothetical protein